MSNKWVLVIGGAIAVLIVGVVVWNSLRSPEAEKIDQSTQELIKEQCRIDPNRSECKK